MDKIKKILFSSLVALATLPSTAFATTPPPPGTPVTEGEGTAIIYNKFESNGIVKPLYSSNYLWSANIEATNHYQINKNITLSSGYSGITIYTLGQKNGSTNNTTYSVGVDEWRFFGGYYYTVETKEFTYNTTQTTTYWNLSTSTHYRVHIWGAVKGNVDVYEATP
ncbi:hypothetical protein WMW72_16265 [Paenibacillus filicis]|uniref:DUF5626 domain-containing protein n=1 Tax=Paenibacillus filicis TaxID=669464 RepID=A0ABU9DKV0_9BACL